MKAFWESIRNSFLGLSSLTVGDGPSALIVTVYKTKYLVTKFAFNCKDCGFEFRWNSWGVFLSVLIFFQVGFAIGRSFIKTRCTVFLCVCH